MNWNYTFGKKKKKKESKPQTFIKVTLRLLCQHQCD